MAAVATALLNVISIAMVRRWNPTREAAAASLDELDSSAAAAEVNIHSAGGRARPVWDNPILWREIRTWAYGKKILLVRIGYWAVFLVCVAVLVTTRSESAASQSSQSTTPVQPLVALLVVSLILLNAAAVTALTNERDAKGARLASSDGFVTQRNCVRQIGRRVL